MAFSVTVLSSVACGVARSCGLPGAFLRTWEGAWGRPLAGGGHLWRGGDRDWGGGGELGKGTKGKNNPVRIVLLERINLCSQLWLQLLNSSRTIRGRRWELVCARPVEAGPGRSLLHVLPQLLLFLEESKVFQELDRALLLGAPYLNLDRQHFLALCGKRTNLCPFITLFILSTAWQSRHYYSFYR